MTAHHDLDKQLTAFLRDGPEELPYESFDAVRDRTEQTSQRVVIGPWRFPTMNRFTTFGIGVVAVAIALFVGAQLIGSPNNHPGAKPTPSADPSSAVSPAAGLALGQFELMDGTMGEDGVPATVNISAPDWHGEPNAGILCKSDDCADPPDGAGLIGPWYGRVYVYDDPCHWASTRPQKPVTTVEEFVAAISRQASRDASEPVDITLDGYHGKRLTLHVPADADFKACDRGYFGSWLAIAEKGSNSPSRYHQGPGQVDELWIVDRDGVLTIMDGAYYDQTPASDVDELRAIVESVNFE